MSDTLNEKETSPERAERPLLPEPSVKTFVSGLAGQVLINLGLFENPATGKKEKSLEMAKYSIDLLQILHEKMRGNLTDEEDKIMATILYDLRMRYVEACR
jgi:hypothetical protein